MAYGARLESVLGESPRGFESPILRHVKTRPDLAFSLLGGFLFWGYATRYATATL